MSTAPRLLAMRRLPLLAVATAAILAAPTCRGPSSDDARRPAWRLDASAPSDTPRPDGDHSDTPSETGVLADAADASDTTDPDAPAPSPAGRSFDGPTVEGRMERGSDPLGAAVGVGLFWQFVHHRKSANTTHQFRPDQPVATLARIDRPTDGGQRWSWQLPERLPASWHYYAAYCDRVGEEQCDREEIDDDTASFAVAKLGLLRSPSGDRKPSDCTFGMIRGKIRCRFGEVVQPANRALAIYVYRPLDIGDFPAFEQWHWNFEAFDDSRLERGWYIALLYSGKSVKILRPDRASPVPFQGQFPMLFE